jgi:hypothetical protein
LEALAALSRSVDEPLADAFTGAWKGRELVWLGRDLKVEFRIEFEGSAPYSLSVDFQPNGRNTGRASERIDTMPMPSTRPRLHTGIYEKVHDPESNMEELSSELDRQDAKKIHLLLSGVHLYRWIPRLLGLPCAPDVSRRFRMTTEGFGLALLIDEIFGVDRAKFNALESQFRQLFPQIKSIVLQPSNAFRLQQQSGQDFPLLSEADGKGLYFEMTSGGALVPASQISDGLLLVLGYVTLLNLPQPPRLLLIEEPENGIHPQRLRDVLRILREVVTKQQHTQVILTTHSPYVIDLFKPEEVTLCNKQEDGSVRVTRLSESAAVRKQKDIFTLGEIWTGEGDEALAKDGVGSQ